MEDKTSAEPITAEMIRSEWEAMLGFSKNAWAAACKRLLREQPFAAAYMQAITEDDGLLARDLAWRIAHVVDAVHTRARGGVPIAVGERALEAAAAEVDAQFGGVTEADVDVAFERLIHGIGFAAPVVVLESLANLMQLGDDDPEVIECVGPLLPGLICIARAYEHAAGLTVTDASLSSIAQAIEDRIGRPVGRNEPCPCGSGKKFKKCCWLAEPPPPPPKRRCDELFQRCTDRIERVFGFLDDLGRHPDAQSISAHLDDFQQRFDAGEPGGIPDSLHVSEALFDFPTPKSGKTLGELYLQRKGERLDEAERQTLERLCASYTAFYQLVELRPAQEVKLLRELGTDTHWLVREVDDPDAEIGDPGEIWLTRVIGDPSEAVSMMSPLIYPAETLADHERMVVELMQPFLDKGLPPADALRAAMKHNGELLADYIVATSPDDDDDHDCDDPTHHHG